MALDQCVAARGHTAQNLSGSRTMFVFKITHKTGV